MDKLNDKKPCIVQTTQGFSVSYNEHLLYSKYNPQKNIIKTIEESDFPDGSIVLCISPVLNYGIEELLSKLSNNCMAILCEADLNLYEFSQNFRKENAALPENEKLFTPAPQELYNLPLWIYEKNSKGQFRRIITIDFSAGSNFHKEFYTKLTKACTDSIMTFWKNRVTLTKFGRKYCRNFFENLSRLPETKPIEKYFKNISKTILCFGAGESTDLFFDSHLVTLENRSNYFILCADTALAALTERGITPDGVFIEEAQSVILKSFIGNPKNTEFQIFAGLSSLPQLHHIFPARQLSYFFTEFTQADFLKRAEEEKILPPKNPPFGSVGLTMVYYALLFRYSEKIPVYICGLDFSYSAGRTHTRSTPHHKAKLSAISKINSLYDFNSAFNSNTMAFIDKGGQKFYTTQILSSYANLFIRYFSCEKNIFDAGKCGIPLGIPRALPELLQEALKEQKEKIQQPEEKYEKEDQVRKFIKEEINALQTLRSLLTSDRGLSAEELQSEIRALAEKREYLFLHYPDGCAFRYDQSFLNRVRTEIDFFLKVLENAPL